MRQHIQVATQKNGRDCPKCVLCLETLSNECLKPSKLSRHLMQKHLAEAEKTVDFLRRKEEHLARQSTALVVYMFIFHCKVTLKLF